MISRLILHCFKQWLRCKPAREFRPVDFVRGNRILFSDLNRFRPPASSSGICQELHMTAIVQMKKPMDRSLDALSTSQQSMILQESGLSAPERLGDLIAFLVR